MEKTFLETCLKRGMSLEAIGEEVGKHPSTVGYWLKKHGLTAAGSRRFSPRGGLDRETLETGIRGGLTLRELAELVDRDISTVRYWLQRYGLKATGDADGRKPRRRNFSGIAISSGTARIMGARDSSWRTAALIGAWSAASPMCRPGDAERSASL